MTLTVAAASLGPAQLVALAKLGCFVQIATQHCGLADHAQVDLMQQLHLPTQTVAFLKWAAAAFLKWAAVASLQQPVVAFLQQAVAAPLKHAAVVNLVQSAVAGYAEAELLQ